MKLFLIILSMIFVTNSFATEIFCSPREGDPRAVNLGHLILKIKKDHSVTGKHISISNNKVSLFRFPSVNCIINNSISLRCENIINTGHGRYSASLLTLNLRTNRGQMSGYLPNVSHKINCVQLIEESRKLVLKLKY